VPGRQLCDLGAASASISLDGDKFGDPCAPGFSAPDMPAWTWRVEHPGVRLEEIAEGLVRALLQHELIPNAAPRQFVRNSSSVRQLFEQFLEVLLLAKASFLILATWSSMSLACTWILS